MSQAQPFSEKKITTEDVLTSGLSEEEYERICSILGREATLTELGIYAALWSEHCSYKNSIRLLKTLPTRSERTLAQAGEENAGVLDIGEGLAVVFKIESHNHPTAIEPYQGAATGVGGIMRDIFTMGARPLCSLNSLRFGLPHEEHNRYLLSRAVKGIGDYGNSLGVPVMGGELFFDHSFARNCLVNAMVVGIAKHEDLAFARAEGVGNPVYIVGATTGRDGVHGAAFASQDLSTESESKRSAVQVGDPFMEKLLMEASLELLQNDIIIGIQDMGAAGLSCAAAEMSAKGKVGMELNLDQVPLRESNMSPYEIMLSESQERMLVVVQKGKEKELEQIFESWDLLAVKIGQVSADNMLSIRAQNKLYAQIPANSLVLGGGAPAYKRKSLRPRYLSRKKRVNLDKLPEAERLDHVFLELLTSPNLCSRRPLYEQYDSEVGLARVIGPGSNGGLARIPDTQRGLAVATDCNSRYIYLDPYIGTAAAVCESARNVAACGAKPIGISNCLNFANPYLPENYYMFSESIRAMRDACKALQIPVTGGNVSFYNESDKGPIFPTPTIAMVALLENLDWHVPAHFQGVKQSIYLLGDFCPVLGGSEYLYHIHKKTAGILAKLDMGKEANLIEFLTELAQTRLLSSACDLSMGGLALALFRSAYNAQKASTVSFQLDFEILTQEFIDGEQKLRKDVLFFGESNNSILISIYPEKQNMLLELAQKKYLKLLHIGDTIESEEFDFAFFKIPVASSVEAYENALVSVF